MIVIHGEQNFGYNLSETTRARCDKALTLKCDGIICSGGLFNKGQLGVPVSQAMKAYLKGRTETPIYTEEVSLTSIHNVEVLSYLREATIVSSWWHIPRLYLIWKMTNTKTKFVPAKGSLSIKRFFLELLGIYTYLLYLIGFKRELNFRNNRKI